MGDGNQIRRGIIVCVFLAVLTRFSVFAGEAEALSTLLETDATIPQCPKNEYFKRCLTNCSNCEQRGICPLQSGFDCTHSGCDCNPRYVRLTPGGKCEPVSKCPIPTCGKNEVFRPCGPICERCSTLRCQVLSCDYKCYCKQGFLRNAVGECIPHDDCPPRTRCSIGEAQGTSGLIDEFCLHEENQEVSNATEVKDRCYCHEGSKRNLMGHCTEYCQFTMCRNGEVFTSCPRKCNTTCDNYGDPECKEDGQCYPGCFCEEGYVLNHRKCVRPEKCPPGTNPMAPTVAPTTEGTQTESSTLRVTTSMPTESTVVVTTAATTQAVTTDVPTKADDDGTTTASDFTTEEPETPQKTKPGKRGKSHSIAQAEAKAEASKNSPKSQTKKPKLVTPDLEDENE